MPDYPLWLYESYARLASDPEIPDRVREAAATILYYFDGVDLDTLPDGVLDPLTGHPFRSDNDD